MKMKLNQKKKQLEKLLDDYLHLRVSHQEISNFAWDVIHYFNSELDIEIRTIEAEEAD